MTRGTATPTTRPEPHEGPWVRLVVLHHEVEYCIRSNTGRLVDRRETWSTWRGRRYVGDKPGSYMGGSKRGRGGRGGGVAVITGHDHRQRARSAALAFGRRRPEPAELAESVVVHEHLGAFGPTDEDRARMLAAIRLLRAPRPRGRPPLEWSYPEVIARLGVEPDGALAAEFGVARGAVQRARQRLEIDGLPRGGVPLEVAHPELGALLDTLDDEQIAAALGCDPRTAAEARARLRAD